MLSKSLTVPRTHHGVCKETLRVGAKLSFNMLHNQDVSDVVRL